MGGGRESEWGAENRIGGHRIGLGGIESEWGADNRNGMQRIGIGGR
jgi:hypothetical protein